MKVVHKTFHSKLGNRSNQLLKKWLNYLRIRTSYNIFVCQEKFYKNL